ncbi:MAG: hypothetical protein WDO71_03960 [Bacteroidota bacterium]
MLPSLYEHECSEGVPGGFLSRVNDGTWMGHVIEHIALEIQTLAEWIRALGEQGVLVKRKVCIMLSSAIWKRCGCICSKGFGKDRTGAR